MLRRFLPTGFWIGVIAPPGQRVALTLTFKIGTGNIIEQEVVFYVEQLPQPSFEVFFNYFLAGQKMIQRGI